MQNLHPTCVGEIALAKIVSFWPKKNLIWICPKLKLQPD